MCDKSLEKQRVVEKLPDDESVVTQKNAQYAPSSIIYPKAHSYYAFAEDIHPSTRIAVSKSLQRERLPPIATEPSQDPRSEVEAVNRYDLSYPPSFVIFGKPSLDSVHLASMIADAWKCVLISPSMLIQEEIDSYSKEGQHMREALENGKCIAPDIVMNLMRRKVKMEDILYRGYVVEGLPLIPDKPSLNRSHSESCEDRTCDRTASCNHQTNNTANPMESSDELICETLPDNEREISQQINEMFTEWPIKPSIIIYMVCPKQDVVSLIMHQRTETATAGVVEGTLGDGLNPSLDLHQDTKEQPIESDDRTNDYLRRVSDVRREIELQCELFMRLALPIINKWILMHDPQRVIRVDGRSSTQRMFQTVDARLHAVRERLFIVDEVDISLIGLKEASKYLTRDIFLPALPLRIAIIGPPKCGKTTLADRFAKTYGIKRISREVALRHMLKHYSWSESARMARDQLQTGQPVSLEYTAHAIETLTLGSRATSHGYVLDDYPSSREEAERLILSGVQPMIVLDLKADLSFLLERQTENNDGTSASSSDFLAYYENWQAHQASFRDWLKRFSQNVVELDATRNKWSVWIVADRAVRSRFVEIMIYHHEADLDKVHSLRYMCVSPFEFRERQSRYESYCPVCLFREDTLQTSRQPTNNQGMVQFKEHFYWICPRHMSAFVEDPQQYLPPVNTAILPDERPRILEQMVDVRHTCWERRLRLDGWCPVTYVDGPTDRRLTRGRADLAVLLGEEEVYLLCSEECRDKFFAKHSKYRNVEITFPREIDPRCLSDTDFLERMVAKEVVEAVKRVAACRPKIVGLSLATSAAIHIGIHLKTHNASADLKETLVYKIADERMAERDKIFRIVIDTMKTRLNSYD